MKFLVICISSERYIYTKFYTENYKRAQGENRDREPGTGNWEPATNLKLIKNEDGITILIFCILSDDAMFVHSFIKLSLTV